MKIVPGLVYDTYFLLAIYPDSILGIEEKGLLLFLAQKIVFEIPFLSSDCHLEYKANDVGQSVVPPHLGSAHLTQYPFTLEICFGPAWWTNICTTYLGVIPELPLDYRYKIS